MLDLAEAVVRQHITVTGVQPKLSLTMAPASSGTLCTKVSLLKQSTMNRANCRRLVVRNRRGGVAHHQLISLLVIIQGNGPGNDPIQVGHAQQNFLQHQIGSSKSSLAPYLGNKTYRR